MIRQDLYGTKGQPVSAKRYNQLVDRTFADTSGDGDYVDSRGTRHRRRSSVASGVVRMKVKAIKKNFLECVEYDGTNEGTETIKVAKPPQLRADASFDGVTFTNYSTDGQTKTATIGATIETHVMNQKWIVNCEIRADIPSGGTGVVDETNNDEEIIWEDVNRTGRNWAKI